MLVRAAVIASLGVLALFSGACFFNVTSYQAADGSTVYVGEVQNDGEPIANPGVEGTFYDAQGNVIASATGDVCRGLPTKGVAAFKVALPPGTAKPARADFKLTGDAGDPALADGLTAELVGTAPPSVGSTVPAVIGVLTNTSANQYVRGFVCAAWTNATGAVIRVEQVSAAGIALPAGGSLPFGIHTVVPPEAVDVTFFLDAGRGGPGHPLPNVATLAQSSFQHTFELKAPATGGGVSYLALGEVRNDGTTPQFIEMSAVIPDGSGKPAGVGSSQGLCNVPAFPGGSTYSGYIVTSADASAAPPTVKIEGEESQWVSLATSGVTHTGGGAEERVSGVVKNTTAETLTRIEVCAAAYDASGKVIGLNPGTLSLPAGGLAPNATVPFTSDVPYFGTVSAVKAIAAGRP